MLGKHVLYQLSYARKWCSDGKAIGANFFGQVHDDTGTQLTNPREWTRAQFVDAIERSTETFVTLTKTGDGKWKTGALVRVVNLDELPNF